MSAGRRLDRLEARAGREEVPPEDEAGIDAELERLIEEYEAREGEGAFKKLVAKLEAEFAAANEQARRWRFPGS